MLSIVQNFVITKQPRLNAFQKIILDYKKYFNKYKFDVNYNTDINRTEIVKLYMDNITQLNIYGIPDKNWAKVTLYLVEQVTTPYVMYLCEDHELQFEENEFENILQECVDNDIDYVNLTRITKYTYPRYIAGEDNEYNENVQPYVKGKYGYFYNAEHAPHKRLSLIAIYKTDFFKKRLLEFLAFKGPVNHDMPIQDIKLPNFYEGYYDFNNGMVRFNGMKCYIPKNPILKEVDCIKER